MTTDELLAAVRFDPQPSTPWVEVYRAQSDTHEGVRYAVKFEPRNDRWSCDCPAYRPCKHIARAKRLRPLRWWLALVADYSEAALADLVEQLAQLAAAGLANERDEAGREAAEWTLAVRRRCGA